MYFFKFSWMGTALACMLVCRYCVYDRAGVSWFCFVSITLWIQQAEEVSVYAFHLLAGWLTCLPGFVMVNLKSHLSHRE